MTRERIQGHLLILTANLIFGLNTPISKWLLSEKLDASLHTMLRMFIAGSVFWIASIFVERQKVPLIDIFKLMICGLCGIAVNQYLFILGLSTTSPVDASVIVTSTPIFVMIFAAFILKEPITILKCAGVAFGVMGAVWLITSANSETSAHSSVWGDFLTLVSSFIYSFYFVISKPLAQKYSPVTMMKWMFLFGFIALIPVNYRSVFLLEGVKSAIDFKTICAIFYVCIFATFLAYLLIPMAIRRIRPTTASMYNYIQPVTSSAVAIIAMQDVLTLPKLLATLMIFAGVFMVTKSKARRDIEAAEKEG